MASFTITDLKKHLGTGLGLRKNKYLIEIPIPGIEGRTLNILCQSAGLPERNITTTTVWKHGRKYNVRGETDYVGNYEVSILDDSDMNVRKVFDKWMNKVDNTKPANQGVLGGSYESGVGEILETIQSGIQLVNNVSAITSDRALDFFLGFIDGGNSVSGASYQTDINIWQLSVDNNKVYGYKLQNAFPSQVGLVTLEDGDENSLSQFNVSFTFSEFIPLENRTPTSRLINALVGDTTSNILSGVESLFD
jgi:hypothetical protein